MRVSLGVWAVVMTAFGSVGELCSQGATPGSYLQVAQRLEPAGSSGPVTLAVDEGTALIGFPLARGRAGSVQVLERRGGAWATVACLTPSDPGALLFGVDVAIDGEVVVVGSRSAPAAAAVYVFVRPPGGWQDMVETIRLSPGRTTEGFGRTVAIDGETIAVGAPFARNELGVRSGVVHVFRRPMAGWSAGSLGRRITPANGGSLEEFGGALALCRDLLVVGAPGASFEAIDRGAVYGYRFDPDSARWRRAFKRSVTTLRGGSSFGDSVVTDGRVLVVGAPDASLPPGFPSRGQAFVFDLTRDEVDPARLFTTDRVMGFGWEAAITESAVVVAANSVGSRVYVYPRLPGGLPRGSEAARVVSGSPATTLGGAIAASEEVLMSQAAMSGSLGTSSALLFEFVTTSSPGCEGSRLTVTGSSRVGGVVDVALPEHAVGVLLIGPRLHAGLSISGGPICGTRACALWCEPSLVISSGRALLAIPRSAVVGSEWCIQGVELAERGCVRATPAATIVVRA